MDQLHVVGSEDPGQVAGSTPNAAAVQSAIQAAGELDPGLQEFYAQKFGHSIQDDIAAAASNSDLGETQANSPAQPSQSAEQAIAAASKDLVLHWQDHAVTHGGVATGSGRELLRSAHTACISVSLDSTDLWVPTTSVFSHAVFKVRPHDLLSVAATFTSGVLVWAVAISAQFAGSSTCVCAR